MEGLRFSKLMSSSYCLSHPSQAVPTALVHLSSKLPRTVLREVQVDYLGALIIRLPWLRWASLVAQTVKTPPATWDTWVRSLGWEGPLEKGMATHSSILAWRIPWAEEPGRLQSMSLKESDTTERLSTAQHIEKQQNTSSISSRWCQLPWPGPHCCLLVPDTGAQSAWAVV